MLSPTSLKERYRNEAKDLHMEHKKVSQLKMKLNLSRPPLDIAPDDKSFHETLNTVYKYC
jgi:hypothetical protein